ncbi:twin-arginine translocase subunit TatC [Fulvimarina sp. 2208YS6-2-32]|uniref:Sec-independent protein translocase protein TatC n=1 Tax=Fulvimarina uroteuthidis TaxID=3098149 RepID=A0ABU5I8L4_9HYPH|nr:twin-arginine translocase subunit TatC [Fulvimarina sp. 2208YS6-2-32]MDY8110601.1 twin-arginine translocase subunit TatC [Fulvimarina sp. 2208YS6-2-32]
MSASNDDIEASSAPLIDHLIELRQRLIRSILGFFLAFIICFFFAKELFNLLVVPYQTAFQWAGMMSEQARFIYTAPQEFFFTQVKIAAFGGLFLSFPIISGQIYKFVAPGLYKNERGAFLPFLVATPILFLLGASLVYFFFMPMVMWFFLSMQQTGAGDQAIIELLPSVSEYLSLTMTLIFAFGMVFQLPVVATLLVRAGITSAEGLVNKRKYAIVIAFIVAAVLTPPDPLSQIGLAVPTILLYEFSILAARYIEKKRARDLGAAEAKAD